MSVEAI